MTSRTTTLVACVAAGVAVVLALGAFVVQRARTAALQETVAAASADARTAITTASPLLERLERVRIVGFESVDAVRTSRMRLTTRLEAARTAVRRQLRAARERAAAADPAATSASAAAGGRSADPPAAPAPRPSGGLLMGDSVSLGAESCLAPLGYRLDSAVGRQFTTGLDLLRVHNADGLPRTVVIHLGTNGPFTESGFAEAMALTAGVERVVWVTIHLPGASRYAFVDSLNQMIRSQAAQYDNVRVADFAAAADQHPEWFAGDGIHISGSGCSGFAGVVDAAVTKP